MIRLIAIRASVAGVVVATAFALMLFTGCENNGEENPSSLISATGTYYGIANLSGGDDVGKSRVKLLLRQYSETAMDENLPFQSLDATSSPLTGYIIYGDSTYIVTGETQNDSLKFDWTTGSGTWTLQGTFDIQGIQSVANGPNGSHTLILNRWMVNTRNIADKWLGYCYDSSCWPAERPLRANLSQNDTLITGFLFVSRDEDLGYTLTICEGSFFDPILELTAMDSDFNPPVKLHLLGSLSTVKSIAGVYDWRRDNSYVEGDWSLGREESDTALVFASILGEVSHGENMYGILDIVYVTWEINNVSISGATISVNGTPLTDYGEGHYSAQLTVVLGTDYVFNIYHPDYGSTSGTTCMPGPFTVSHPRQDAVVTRGVDLAVTFTQASGASLYEAWLHGNGAYTAAMSPATSLTLPGASIQNVGADELCFDAVCGDYDQWMQSSSKGFYGVYSKVINLTAQ